jgi:diguanylate cyclase (GGDEF)-like protein
MRIGHGMSKKRGLSVNSLLLWCFILVAILPTAFFAVKVYDAAWENAWREVREKHQLLAENLTAPISIYVRDQQSILSLTSHLIAKTDSIVDAESEGIRDILSNSLNSTHGFNSIFLLNNELKVINFVSNKALKVPPSSLWFNKYDFLNVELHNGKNTVSQIIQHPFVGGPSIFIASHVNLENVSSSPVILVAELQLDPIEQLRRRIRFGKEGHSAIVDANGRVIAHPNANWMSKVHDLSQLDIIQNMMAGNTGIMEFYSPFKKQQMVAGYTVVPNLGWGVMVPQPLAEIRDQVHSILYAQFFWGLLGLTLAIFVALYIGRWITRPINELAAAGQQLSKEDFKGNLPKPRSSAPKEVQQLAAAFSDAIDGLTLSRTEIEGFNQNLQTKIDDATTELTQANKKLSVLARSDHLTKLANRRHFEQALSKMTSRRKCDEGDFCLLMVDIDHFKNINDQYGHASGDMVLVNIANILDKNMRQSDLAARYAGDEFVILIRADLDVGRGRATTILNEIARQKFIYNKVDIGVTVSIGIVSFHVGDQSSSVDSILKRVDEALYTAKRSGRNIVSEVAVDDVKA